MKIYFLFVLAIISTAAFAQKKTNTPAKPTVPTEYLNNRAPLRANPYIELPIGAIKPQGWLKEMLIRQKNGATGQLDKLYPLVMNERNGWLGGDGDQWERGPYWIDGLLPLAYILDDKELIAKAKKWVDWALASQQPDGYFGPSKDYPHEAGLQRNNSRDWWPKMVMLKILKQYYMATQDKRVIPFMTNYFRYQLKELPSKPLSQWTFWAEYRGTDNLAVVYWLYNITGDAFLLELGDLIHKQHYNFTKELSEGRMLAEKASIHCVNLAQGIKEPMIYYQQHPEQLYIDATKKGFADLRRYNGMAHGLYGGDEALHGNNPIQGSELCSAVEMMFSLESILPITGDVDFADQLEKIAFNALPAQTSDDYMTHQYFQQANQVMATRGTRMFEVNHLGTDLCYGLLTGYPCCTSNMHQGFPKFAQNLWYATATQGLAALVYSASEVTAAVGMARDLVTIKEETNYPFDESVFFTITTAGAAAGSKGSAASKGSSASKASNASKGSASSMTVSFPFDLRIPAWCKKATIKINGETWKELDGGQIATISRTWKSGDKVELILPMHLSKSRWYENSVSVERGPITYALKIGEEVKKTVNSKDPEEFGPDYLEVRPTTAWNYGLPSFADDKMPERFNIEKISGTNTNFPWNLENAPIRIKTKGRKIPTWKLYNEMTGPIPFSTTYQLEVEPEEDIILVPYGCTQLRISQFPVVRRN